MEHIAYYYFQRKMQQWGNTVQERKDYIKRTGRTGLKMEFESDPNFRSTICPLIHQIGDVQLKSDLLKEVGPFIDEWFGMPLIGEADIVVGAVADACGYTTTGDKLLKTGLGIVGLFVIGLLISKLGD
jgi:hypothetical protein